jgi:hypothetical protein
MLGTRWKSSIRNSPIESHPRAQGEGPRNLVVHVRTTVRVFGPSSPQDDSNGGPDWHCLRDSE